MNDKLLIEFEGHANKEDDSLKDVIPQAAEFLKTAVSGNVDEILSFLSEMMKDLCDSAVGTGSLSLRKSNQGVYFKIRYSEKSLHFVPGTAINLNITAFGIYNSDGFVCDGIYPCQIRD